LTQQFQQEFSSLYFTSAMTNDGIEELFIQIAQIALKQLPVKSIGCNLETHSQNKKTCSNC
jgi:hypothetical protein